MKIISYQYCFRYTWLQARLFNYITVASYHNSHKTYAKGISFQDQEYLKNLRAHELARQHGKARADTELNEFGQKFKKKFKLELVKISAHGSARLGLARLMKQSNPNIRIFLIFF